MMKRTTNAAIASAPSVRKPTRPIPALLDACLSRSLTFLLFRRPKCPRTKVQLPLRLDSLDDAATTGNEERGRDAEEMGGRGRGSRGAARGAGGDARVEREREWGRGNGS